MGIGIGIGDRRDEENVRTEKNDFVNGLPGQQTDAGPGLQKRQKMVQRAKMRRRGRKSFAGLMGREPG